eukprot:scaffold655_cov379-Prasinococcus_capsulatus_cf.AAC.3
MPNMENLSSAGWRVHRVHVLIIPWPVRVGRSCLTGGARIFLYPAGIRNGQHGPGRDALDTCACEASASSILDIMESGGLVMVFPLADWSKARAAYWH